jgi:hypothetical protein
MEAYPLITKARKALETHRGKALTRPVKNYLSGIIDALTAVEMYMQNVTIGLDQFMTPESLLIVPSCVKDTCDMLRDMRTSCPINPELRFRFIADSQPDHAWFPIEYDGEYNLYGYVSRPHFAGLQVFTIQSLPSDVKLCTEWIPKTYKELQ